MSYKVEATATFQKELKPLVKKYPSLKKEFLALVEELENNPELGTPLGQGCFKIRIAIKSKGKGKSGGGRVITCVKILKKKVTLLTIYDKSEKESISDADLKELLKEVL